MSIGLRWQGAYARLHAWWTLVSLRLGARVLVLYSVLAAAAGIEVLALVAVWPVGLAGLAIAAVTVIAMRRRGARRGQ